MILITLGRKWFLLLFSVLDLMADEEEEVRMVLPLLVQSLTGRELDSHLSSVELARTAVHKVRMVLPLLVQSLTGRELDSHLSSVELARTAVHKVRMVLPLLVESWAPIFLL